jgi:hypothetical protein
LPFIGNQPALSYTSFAKQDFTTSATTSYTLDHPVTNENEIALFINFVRQEPTTAYSASNTSLTLTSATSASDDMYCVFLGKAVQTINPPNSSVGNSQLDVSAINSQTAETSIAGGDEVLIYDTSASALRKMTRTNFVSGIGGDNTPSWSATIDSNQTLSDSTDTLLNFDNETYDTDGAYDTTNKRFTVPSGEAGKYFITTFFRASSLTNMTSQFRLQIRKNGSAFRQVYLYSGGAGTAMFNYTNDNGNYAFHLSTIMDLSVGDYVDVTALFDTTGNFTVQGSGTGLRSEFSGFKLIGV